MKQEEVIQKVLEELISEHLVPRRFADRVKMRLSWVWVAGWEEGRAAQYAKRKPVIKFSLAGNRIAEYHSASEAARKNNLTKHSISRACLRKIRTAGGYIWRYRDE